MRTMTESEVKRILAIERPDPQLWTYYWLTVIRFGPLFPAFLVYLWFRYHTLRYRFDEKGMSMSWGILFRREIHLTYARIQDIHLASNFIERWLGLARLRIQTASGSSEAEVTIEGVRAFAPLRDFLYGRMRGVHEPVAAAEASGAPAPAQAEGAGAAAVALREAAAELRALSAALAARRAGDA